MTDQATTMAHLRDLPRPTCERCGRNATVQLFNGVNAPLGKYCSPCGQRELRSFKEGSSRG